MSTEPNQPADQPAETPGAPVAPPAPSPAQPPRPMVPSFIPASVAAAAANPKSKNASRLSGTTIALVLAFVVAGAGLGFAGGRLTAPASNGGGNRGGFVPGGSFAPGASGEPGRNGGFGGFNGSVSITGQVTAIANGSITVQTSSGQNVTIEVPSSVTYHAQTAASATDVAVGTNVTLSVNRPNFRPGASGVPAASPATPGGGLNFTATDILVLGK